MSLIGIIHHIMLTYILSSEILKDQSEQKKKPVDTHQILSMYFLVISSKPESCLKSV